MACKRNTGKIADRLNKFTVYDSTGYRLVESFLFSSPGHSIEVPFSDIEWQNLTKHLDARRYPI